MYTKKKVYTGRVYTKKKCTQEEYRGVEGGKGGREGRDGPAGTKTAAVSGNDRDYQAAPWRCQSLHRPFPGRRGLCSRPHPPSPLIIRTRPSPGHRPKVPTARQPAQLEVFSQ